jgi:putative methionine-R-sulfoxide reductase with GAF domain
MNKNNILKEPHNSFLNRLQEFPHLQRLSLRIKLPMIIIALVVLAFLVSTFLSVQAPRSALVEQLQQTLLEQAVSQADLIRSHLVWTRNTAVDMAAIAGAVDQSEDNLLKTIESTLANNEQIFGSAVAYEPYRFQPDQYYWSPYYSRTPGGDLQFTQLGNPEYDYFKWDWYTLPKEQGTPVLSSPYFDKGGGEIWMVTWSVPFFDAAGTLKGVATADIAFSQTQDIVRQIKVGEQGYAFLVDKQGTLLGIGDQGSEYQIMIDSLLTTETQSRDTSWDAVINAMVKGDSGFSKTTDLDGQSVYVAYHPIGLNTGWSLGLVFPETELFQPAAELRNTLIIFSVLVASAFAVILYFFTRTITQPLQALALHTTRFSQEELKKGQVVDAIHIQTHDELEDLANAFNVMAVNLTDAFSNMEERIASRTKDLATVAEVSTATATILETQKLLQAVVDLAKERFGLYHAHIYLLDEEGGKLVLAAGAGEPGRIMAAEKRFIPLNREQSLVARAARERKGVTVNDVTQAPEFLPNPLLPDTRAELAVPMIAGGSVIGVFDIQSELVGRFTESDINIQTTLAAQLATSIQNVRSFEHSRKQAELESMVNTIGQRIQRTTSIEETLQTAIRELGTALGASRVRANLSRSEDSGDLTGRN